MSSNSNTNAPKRQHIKNNIATLLILIGIALCFLIVVSSCNDDGVELKPTAQLSVVDVGVTEVWLRILLDSEPGTFTLKRNDSVISSFHTPIDTVFYDEGLLPAHTYTYKTEKGTSLAVTTMDTTNHIFTWDVTTLGDGNSSVLYDVAIVNDTCVYAVGEIYKKDSTGQFDQSPFGLAKWNGKEWKIQHLYALSPSGNYYSILSPNGICAFSETDVWFANSGVFNWNGHGEYVTPYWINAIPGNPNSILSQGQKTMNLWGTSSSHLFIVGTNGAMAYYNGSLWQKIESSTTTDINDIWGLKNPLTKEEEVYSPVTDVFAFKDRKILKITNITHIDSIEWTPQREVVSVWTPNSLALFACGDWVYKYTNNVWKRQNIGANIYTTHIRGTGLNNIFTVGPFGLISHYNGTSWKLMTGVEAGNYTSVEVKGNMVVAVGTSNEEAIVAVGKRNF